MVTHDGSAPGGEGTLRKGEAYVGVDTVMWDSSPTALVFAVTHGNIAREGARLEGRRGSQYGGEGREEGDERELHFGGSVVRGFDLEELRLDIEDGRCGLKRRS